jgi:hypothetical protein
VLGDAAFYVHRMRLGKLGRQQRLQAFIGAGAAVTTR